MKKLQSSDYFNRLEKYLGIDEEGNITIGKNLEVDGNAILNSGLAPIETYQIGVNAKIQIFIERPVQYLNYSAIGLLTLTDSQVGYIVTAYYVVGDNKEITSFVANSANKIFSLLSNGYVSFDGIASEDDLKKLQSKLYKHTLTLTADSQSYILIYQSTNNLSVGSIADLRAMTNVKTSSDNVILPVCLADLTGTAALQITTTLCKIGTANVTAVSDKVTL